MIIKLDRGGVRIRNATKQGYLVAYPGDGVDISTRMETHRGTVQKDMAQTLQTEICVGVIEIVQSISGND